MTVVQNNKISLFTEYPKFHHDSELHSANNWIIETWSPIASCMARASTLRYKTWQINERLSTSNLNLTNYWYIVLLSLNGIALNGVSILQNKYTWHYYYWFCSPTYTVCSHQTELIGYFSISMHNYKRNQNTLPHINSLKSEVKQYFNNCLE